MWKRLANGFSKLTGVGIQILVTGVLPDIDGSDTCTRVIS